jgi:hypothetical protein
MLNACVQPFLEVGLRRTNHEQGRSEMDNDKQAIDDAYAGTLKNLYNVMLSSYITANGNQPDEKRADDAFKLGLAIARKVQKTALALL